MASFSHTFLVSTTSLLISGVARGLSQGGKA